jgi:hypothetical protein
MKRAVIEQRLQLAEQRVAESQKRVSRHEGIVAKLEIDGRQNSLTAGAARSLLQSFQNELSAHLADRDRLRQQLHSTS